MGVRIGVGVRVMDKVRVGIMVRDEREDQVRIG